MWVSVSLIIKKDGGSFDLFANEMLDLRQRVFNWRVV